MLFGEFVQSVVYGIGIIRRKGVLRRLLPRFQNDLFDPPIRFLRRIWPSAML